MSVSVFRTYVQKDLFFATPIMIGAVLCGIISIGLVHLGSVGTYAALIVMICAGASPAVFICMYSILGERKERSNLFAVSLPISTSEYVFGKLTAACLGFLVPWGVLALGALLVFRTLPVPAGVLPAGVLFWGFTFVQFAGMLAVTMLSDSEALTVAAIVVFNVSISFYIFLIMHIPDVAAHVNGKVAVWSPVVFEFLAGELLLAVLIIALLLVRLARKRDFI